MFCSAYVHAVERKRPCPSGQEEVRKQMKRDNGVSRAAEPSGKQASCMDLLMLIHTFLTSFFSYRIAGNIDWNYIIRFVVFDEF